MASSSHPLLPDNSLLAAMFMPVRFAFTVTLVFLGLLIACWIVVLFMFFTSWQRDATPLLAVFQSDLQMLVPGAPFAHMADLAQTTSVGLHKVLFVMTGLESVGQQAAPVGESGIVRGLNVFFNQMAPGVNAMGMATQWFGMRAALLAGMAPLALLVYVFASVDGLAERLIRRAGAGRESASLYHRAKYGQYVLVGSVLVVMLCVPAKMNAVMVMLVTCTCLLLLTRLQWSFYKKYL